MFRIISSRLCGFTIIELMIVLVIVSILASIAIPPYQNSIRKGRRGDAKAELTRLAQAQQKHRVTNTIFAGDVALGTPDSTYYAFSVTSNSATAFSITATPQSAGGQDQDTCATLTINEDAVINSSDSAACPSP